MQNPYQESAVIAEIRKNEKQDKQGPITQELLDHIQMEIYPCYCFKLESCHGYNRLRDEPDSWIEGDIGIIQQGIDHGYGPFFDMLFSGTKGNTNYLIVRAHLMRIQEKEKAESEHRWKCYKMPEIINGGVAIGILSLCVIGAIASFSYIATGIAKML